MAAADKYLLLCELTLVANSRPVGFGWKPAFVSVGCGVAAKCEPARQVSFRKPHASPRVLQASSADVCHQMGFIDGTGGLV